MLSERNLPEEVSAEAAQPAEPVRIGSMLAAIGAELGFVDMSFERDQTPLEPADFG